MLKQPFFDAIRPTFGGSLTTSQVAGMERIENAFYLYGDRNLETLAYILATSFWETGKAMMPVKETQFPGQPVPTDAEVIARLDRAFAQGKLPWVKKPYWRTGFFGRGDVQLTHEANYNGPVRTAVMEEFKGLDIHAQPGLVLGPQVSAFILVKGTMEGWFTGRKLANYIDNLDESDKEDLLEFIEARRVVNGLDKAKEIGNLALSFEKALKVKGAWTDDRTPIPELPSTPIPEQAVAHPSLLGYIIGGLIVVAAIAAYYFLKM